METWIQSKEFNSYEASSEGRIRNSKTGRIMKTSINKRGYEQVCLRKDKQQHVVRVHRIIADAFYDGGHADLDVNHKDGNKLNNRSDNLEFCTRQANIRHAFDNGLKTPSRQKKVRVVETGNVYDSIRACGRDIGCNQSDICKCLNGKSPHVKGFHFEYME
jgi:hypothetical protein